MKLGTMSSSTLKSSRILRDLKTPMPERHRHLPLEEFLIYHQSNATNREKE
jgi:hypothetical protein